MKKIMLFVVILFSAMPADNLCNKNFKKLIHILGSNTAFVGALMGLSFADGHNYNGEDKYLDYGISTVAYSGFGACFTKATGDKFFIRALKLSPAMTLFYVAGIFTKKLEKKIFNIKKEV